MKWYQVCGVLLLAAIVAGGKPMQAQVIAPMAKDAHPVFEVATIKLTDPASKRAGINTSGRRVGAQGQTLKNLMVFAYGLHANQIEGAPAWMTEDRYDIDGVADVEGNPNSLQMREMFKRLLVERFGLTFHPDKKEMAYYAVLVAKTGPKLKDSVADPNARPNTNIDGNKSETEMRFTGVRMDGFVSVIVYFVDRPVIDETGLKGRYDFILKWRPDDAPPTEGDQLPGMFTATQEQLGLKLEAKRGPLDVMVVDEVKRPSEN